MDPRHPEQAISRMRELMKQYDRIEKDMGKATTSAQLGQLEREGGLVVQEICLVAPRIHEAMMQTSRQRRHDLSHGVIVDMSKYKVPAGATGEEEGVVAGPTDQIIAVNEATTEEAEVVKKPVEELVRNKADVIGEENIGGESVSVKKPATKKTTRKKKTTKKAEK